MRGQVGDAARPEKQRGPGDSAVRLAAHTTHEVGAVSEVGGQHEAQSPGRNQGDGAADPAAVGVIGHTADCGATLVEVREHQGRIDEVAVDGVRPDADRLDQLVGAAVDHRVGLGRDLRFGGRSQQAETQGAESHSDETHVESS